MARDLVVKVGDTDVVIEVAESYGDRDMTAAGRVQEAAEGAFDHAREMIRAMTFTMIDDVKGFPDEKRPSEFSMQFGLKFTVSGSVKVVGVGAEAQMQVSIVYRPESPPNTGLGHPSA